MVLGDLIVQNFFGIVASVIASVLGWLAIRILRGVRASADRTEAHAQETAQKVSQLDQLSTGSYQSGLDEWKRDILLRVESVAESKSDTLAWQANIDRELRAMKEVQRSLVQFAEQLSDFAHGAADVPTFTTTTINVLQEEPA